MNIIVRKKTCEFLGIFNKIVFTLFFSISSVFLGCQVSYGCSFTHDDLSDEEDKVAPFEKKQAFQSWGAVFDDESGKVTLPIRADHLQSLEALLTNHEEILDFYDPYVTLESSPNARMFQTFTKFKRLSGLKMVRGQELTIQEAETIGKIIVLFSDNLEEIDFRGIAEREIRFGDSYTKRFVADEDNKHLSNNCYYSDCLQPLIKLENYLPIFTAMKTLKKLKSLSIHAMDLNQRTYGVWAERKNMLRIPNDFQEMISSQELLERLDLSYSRVYGLDNFKSSKTLQYYKSKVRIQKEDLLKCIKTLDLSNSESLGPLPLHWDFLSNAENLEEILASKYHLFSTFTAGSYRSPNLPTLNTPERFYPLFSPKGELTAIHLDALPHPEKITKLDLSYNMIETEGIRNALSILESLKYLDLSHNNLDDWIMLFASSLVNLEYFDISHNLNITSEALANPEILPQSLKLFNFSGHNIKWAKIFEVIEAIEKRPNHPKAIGFEKKDKVRSPILRYIREGGPLPEQINLMNRRKGFPCSSFIDIGEAGARLLLDRLAGKKVKSLLLRGFKEVLPFLKEVDLSELEEISFPEPKNLNFHQAMPTYLKKSPIQKLCVSREGINLHTISQHMPTLQHLELNGCHINIDSFGDFKNLKTLITRQSCYFHKNPSSFIEVLCHHPNLRELDMSYVKGLNTSSSAVGKKDKREGVINFLFNAPNLEKLSIVGIEHRSDKDYWAARDIFDALAQFLEQANKGEQTNLTHLDIGGDQYNKIPENRGSINWGLFCFELSENTTLRHLSLIDLQSKGDYLDPTRPDYIYIPVTKNGKKYHERIYNYQRYLLAALNASKIESVNFLENNVKHKNNILNKTYEDYISIKSKEDLWQKFSKDNKDLQDLKDINIPIYRREKRSPARKNIPLFPLRDITYKVIVTDDEKDNLYERNIKYSCYNYFSPYYNLYTPNVCFSSEKTCDPNHLQHINVHCSENNLHELQEHYWDCKCLLSLQSNESK